MKVIAIDLDGTLLNRHHKISEENKQAILQAQEQGIDVVIATGRAHFDVFSILKEAELTTWVIAANGATIHRPDGTLEHSVPLDKQQALACIDWLDREQFYFEIFSDDAIYQVPGQTARLLSERGQSSVAGEEIDKAIAGQNSQYGLKELISIEELTKEELPIYNILALSFLPEKRMKGEEQFKGRGDMTYVTSSPYNFELEHTEASKGIALTTLMKKWGIDLKDTMTIGDSMNDFSMMAVAGKRVAMENAREEIKHIADYVTLHHDRNGVAHAIHQELTELVK